MFNLPNLGSGNTYEVFVSKLDSAGNFVWAKRIGSNNEDTGYGIALDIAGNVYVSGSFSTTADFDPGSGTFNLSSAGSYDAFVAKLDSGGNFTWAKRVGGTGIDIAASLALDSAGNIYTTGLFSSTNADFDPSGSVFTLASAGGTDVFIDKLDSLGNFVWAKRFGGSLADYGNGVAVDSAGNVYTTGQFSLTVDFDPSGSVFNLASTGAGDIFTTKLNSAGNFVWANRMGGRRGLWEQRRGEQCGQHPRRGFV